MMKDYKLICEIHINCRIMVLFMLNYSSKEKRVVMRFNRGRRYSYYSSYSSRQRVRWDRIAIIGVVVALVIGVLVWFNLSRIQLMFKGYSFAQQSDILSLKKDEVNEILSHDKLEHIEDWIKASDQVKFYDEYEKYYSLHDGTEVKEIVSTVDTMFTNYIPKLEALQYTEDQIWEVLKTATVDDLQNLVDKKYTYQQIQPYMQVKGFVFRDIDKYMEVYNEKKNYNYAVLITTYPFIISTNEVTQSYTIYDPDNILALVKKGFQLPSSYVPSDLVKPDKIPVAPDCENFQMRKEAADALTKMYQDAKSQGYNLVINSAYRSYESQKKTYDDYFAKYDERTAASLVALPGCSEHQTGLGVDLTSQSVVSGERLVFGDTVEYKWCLENAYKYGFILRFEEDKVGITGIGKEPWHFRYVGKDVAKKIYDNQWTLEEYCLYEGVLPNLKSNA